MDERGLTDFERLRSALAGRGGSRAAFLYAFDRSKSTAKRKCAHPWEIRRAMLARLLRTASPGIRLSAQGRVVISSRERRILLEPMGQGIRGVTPRFAHDVRSEDEYFAPIPEMALPAEMLKLAERIIETKGGRLRSVDARGPLDGSRGDPPRETGAGTAPRGSRETVKRERGEPHRCCCALASNPNSQRSQQPDRRRPRGGRPAGSAPSGSGKRALILRLRRPAFRPLANRLGEAARASSSRSSRTAFER